MAVTVTQTVRELRELIAALDRRVPRVASVGEAAIARDAAALRAQAVTRLAELTVQQTKNVSAPQKAAPTKSRQ